MLQFAPILLLLATQPAAAFMLPASLDSRENLVAQPGESLFFETRGNLTLHGMVATQAGPDGQGPSIVLRIHNGRLVLGEGALIHAADGRDARNVEGEGMSVGLAGGKGGSIHIEALAIECQGGEIRVGNGGAGGTAHAIGLPDAVAYGGLGGAGGAYTGSAAGCIHGGSGGIGGAAYALGQPSCIGGNSKDDYRSDSFVGDGQDAHAKGGAGGKACVNRDGDGGQGGDATAYGGSGGPATTTGAGGKGGDAIANAGRGGDGADLCVESVAEFEVAVQTAKRPGNGGMGGRALAVGGNGGLGISVGGRGGSAFANSTSGSGGKGTYVQGVQSLLTSKPSRFIQGGTGGDGAETNATGGNGGPGAVVGGNGGSAGAYGAPGNGGQFCYLDGRGSNGIPAGPLAPAAVALAVALRRVSRRG